MGEEEEGGVQQEEEECRPSHEVLLHLMFSFESGSSSRL